MTSSSLSAIACISAWVGGLETVKPSGVTEAAESKRSWMAWNWVRNSPETIGELSAGKLGSRIGVDISNFGLFPPVLRPPARQHKPGNDPCPPGLNDDER
jgi:hypothetical protein